MKGKFTPANAETASRTTCRDFSNVHVRIAGTRKIDNIATMSNAFPPRLRTQSHSPASVDNAHSELSALEPAASIVLIWTPGSFEIPLFVQAAAELKRFQAIIALGVILEGETLHAQLIAEAVSRALLEISLKYKLPVLHGVLLLKDEAQAKARCMGTEHNRGVEVARAAVSAARKLPEIV